MASIKHRVEVQRDLGEGRNRIQVYDWESILYSDTGEKASRDPDQSGTLACLYHAIERIHILENSVKSLRPTVDRLSGLNARLIDAFHRYERGEGSMPFSAYETVLADHVRECELAETVELAIDQIPAPQSAIEDLLDTLGVDINLALANSNVPGFEKDLRRLQARFEQLRGLITDVQKQEGGDLPGQLTYTDDGAGEFDIYDGTMCVGHACNEQIARQMCGGAQTVQGEKPTLREQLATVFGIGSAAQSDNVILANVKNALRRSRCLSRIETKFFTFPTLDEDGEEGEDCYLSWGAAPEQYSQQFEEAVTRLYGNHAALAALHFALEPDSDGLEFLRVWREGNFEAIRREWPEAPEDVFIGADSLHLETKQPRLHPDSHPDDAAVDRFAVALKQKMADSREKGRSGWENKVATPPGRLQKMLCDHVKKGDPVDVGNFAMMLWNRGESTTP